MVKKGFPIQRYERKRRFDGKLFMLVDHLNNKRDAQRLQANIKEKGHLARIIKTKHGYEVWSFYGNR